MSGCEKGWKLGMSGENYSKNLGSTIGDTIYNFFFYRKFLVQTSLKHPKIFNQTLSTIA